MKVWDRRVLGNGKPIGVLVGHLDGITHIDSKGFLFFFFFLILFCSIFFCLFFKIIIILGDGRYLISNSKDQSIKLWDIRTMQDQVSFSFSFFPILSIYLLSLPSQYPLFFFFFQVPSDHRPRSWDYRFNTLGGHMSSQQAKVFRGELKHAKDTSVITFR